MAAPRRRISPAAVSAAEREARGLGVHELRRRTAPDATSYARWHRAYRRHLATREHDPIALRRAMREERDRAVAFFIQYLTNTHRGTEA